MPKTQKDLQTTSSTEKPSPRGRKILIADPLNLAGQILAELIASDPLLVKFNTLSAQNYEATLGLIRASDVDVLLIVDAKASAWFETLKIVRVSSPTTMVILVARDWSEDDLRNSVNLVHIFRMLPLQKTWSEILQHLRAACLESELAKAQLTLMREASGRNRELESLTSDLEKIVQERTFHIQASKEETDEKLDRARQLIRFTKELAQNISFEEIMNLIRRELRRFPKIGEPLLLLQVKQGELEILWFRSSVLQERKIKKDFSFPVKASLNDKALGLELANLMGRPFAQVMAFPLDIGLIRKYGQNDAAALLCFEHGMPEAEQENLLRQIQEILKPISMALDRSFLEREMMIHSLRWEKTFDGLRDPIAVIDEQFHVLRANNKFSDRLTHRKCFQIFAGREEPCTGCPMLEAQSKNQVQVGTIRRDDRDFQVTSFPIRLPGSTRASSSINQYFDVTQSRQIYARMLQSEKMSALGLLAGNIAHELNNPLSGIRNLVQVMVSEEQSHQEWPQVPDLASDLSEIERAAGRSQKIIRNLLEYSGEREHQTSVVSLPEIIERTMPLLKTVLRQHRLKLDLQNPDALVRVDTQLLQQVVFNLINNACQAMKENGELIVKTDLFSEGKKARITVRDSGPGIPKALQQKVFEAFYTTKNEDQGTGLGLSISRDIVRRFGGEIELESEVGFGAEFRVILPVEKSSTEPQ